MLPCVDLLVLCSILTSFVLMLCKVGRKGGDTAERYDGMKAGREGEVKGGRERER